MAKKSSELIATLVHAVHTQHQAIDVLMARLVMVDPHFRPSQSGSIWDAVKLGHGALQDWAQWERGGGDERVSSDL